MINVIVKYFAGRICYSELLYWEDVSQILGGCYSEILYRDDVSVNVRYITGRVLHRDALLRCYTEILY